MKKNTLETLLKALQEEKEEILLDDQTLLLARKALENMINL